MSTMLTHIERSADDPDRQIPFTARDRQMLVEIHEAIMATTLMLGEVIPKLEGNPLFKMLAGSKRR